MRLIDADELAKEFEALAVAGWNTGQPTSWGQAYEEASDIVDNAPTIEAEPVRHGKWEYIGGYGYQHRCSKCFMCAGYRTNYCPNCGAKMDEHLSYDK